MKTKDYRNRKQAIMPKVTLQTIADAIGTSRNTVSRALRNDPKISNAMRQRVHQKADAMGYRKDAELSRLMGYLAASKRKGDITSELAYLWTLRALKGKGPSHPIFFEAAKKEAATFGYRLEPYCLGSDGHSAKALERIWQARNVRGVLLGPPQPDAPLEDIDWNRYAVVGYGQSFDKFHYHRLNWDFQWAVQECYRRLWACGHRRIGIICSHTGDKHLGFSIRAAKAIQDSLHPEVEPVPTLSNDYLGDEALAPDLIQTWIEEFEPDAIISHGRAYEVMQRLGYRIPQDFSYAEFHLGFRHEVGGELYRTVAGIVPSEEAMGKTSLGFLVGQLNNHVFGLPAAPTLTLIEGHWADGETVKKRLRRKSASAAH